MKFYTFYQTNAGGRVFQDENVEKLMVVEAASGQEAWEKLWDIVEDDYLEGCECCDPRWEREYTDEGDEPLIFGDPVREEDYGCIIYFADGSKERILEK